MAEAPSIICILAIPRTGSTRVIALLSQLSGLRVRTEIFHPKRSFLLAAEDLRLISAAAHHQFIAPDDPALLHFMRTNPGLCLDSLVKDATTERAPLVFKLFPGHISRHSLCSELFSRKDVRYIVIKRRPFDSYVSALKAKELSTHNNKNTTALKVKVPILDFVAWLNRSLKWYEFCANEIARYEASSIELLYERDINVDDHKCLETLQLALRRFGISTEIERPNSTFSSIKQDLTLHPRDKVSNWATFNASLRLLRQHSRAFSYF